MGLNDLLKAVEQYGGSGGGSFFKLENDRDSATVRFLHTDGDDLDWYVVHADVVIDGKRRNVACLQDKECPLCQAGNRPKVKLFLQMDVKGELKIWERGQTFVPKILGFINKYGDLNSRDYEIERQGKKGDTKTDYALYPLDKTENTSKLERQSVLGPNGIVIDAKPEDMRAMAKGTYVPAGATPPAEPPLGRRQASNPEDTF